MEHKKIYRTRDDKVISGVIGGLAKYFGVNPTIMRLASVFVIVATGIVPGAITYIAATLIMPLEPYSGTDNPAHEDKEQEL